MADFYIVPPRKTSILSGNSSFVHSLNGLNGFLNIVPLNGDVTVGAAGATVTIGVPTNTFVHIAGDTITGNLQFIPSGSAYGLRIANLPSDPASPLDGSIYYNSSTNVAKMYSSGIWTTFSGAGYTPGTVTSITAGTGLTGGTVTTVGTFAVDVGFSPIWTGSHTFSNPIVFSGSQIFNVSQLSSSGFTMGDMLYFNGSNWVNIALGVTGQYLSSGATVPVWANVTHGTITSIATTGGITGGTITSTGTLSLDLTYSPTWTGVHTFAQAIVFAAAQTYNAAKLTIAGQFTGDILYASSGSDWARLGIGSAGQLLGISGGVPSWFTPLSSITAGVGLTGGTITTTGTLAIDQSFSPTWTGNHVFTNSITFAAGQPFNAANLTITSEAAGDILYSTGSAFTKLPIGTAGQVLAVTAGLPSWIAAPATGVTSITAGTGLTGGVITSTGTIALDLTYSPTWTGTHTFSNAIVFAAAQTFNAVKLTIPSQATGDVLYASSASAWTRLGVGTDGQVLTLASGLPSWITPAPTGVTSITAGTGLTGGVITSTGTIAIDLTYSPTWTGVHTFTQAIVFAAAQTFNAVNLTITSQATGDVLYASSPSAWSRLGIGTAGQVLTATGGVPSWAGVPVTNMIVREIPTGLLNGINTVFVLSQTPAGSTEQVFLNGVLQESGGADYTISSATITFNTPPSSSAIVLVTYNTSSTVIGFTNPMTTLGDIVVATTGGVANRLGIGTAGQILTVVGGTAAWTTVVGTGSVTSITAGTGLTGGTITTTGTIAVDLTYSPTWTGVHTFTQAIVFAGAQTFNAVKLTIGSQAAGDILYASSGSAWARLSAGTDGQILTLASGIPSWATVTGTGTVTSIIAGTGLTGGTITTTGTIALDLAYSPTWTGTHTFNNAISFAAAQTFNAAKLTIASQATGDILYASSASVWSRLAVGTNGQVLTLTSGIPSWATVTGTGTVTSITAGTGLTGGTITSSGTIALDLTYSPTWTGTHTFNNAIIFAIAQTFNAANLTITSQATGDILYASSPSGWSRLGIGSNGQVLTLVSGIPAWTAAGSGSGTVTSITAGTGLTGGTITTAGTIALDLTYSPTWTGTHIFTARVEFSKGANVASANNLVLGTDGNIFHITGSTQINLLSSAAWQAGSEIFLIFDSTPTVKNNQTVSGANKPILLRGGQDFVASVNSVLALTYDGTSWYDSNSGLTAANIGAAASGANSDITSLSTVTNFAPTGLTGATAASRYVGATTAGSPTSGTFSVGDFVIDQTGAIWVCVTAGTPGKWFPLGGILLANNQTGTTYSLALSDVGMVVELNNSSAITLTVTKDATITWPLGAIIEIWQQGTGQVTIVGDTGVTLISDGSLVHTRAQYATVSLRRRAANTWVLSGDLA